MTIEKLGLLIDNKWFKFFSMRYIFFFLIVLAAPYSFAQSYSIDTASSSYKKALLHFVNNSQNSKASFSEGKVSDGKLINGKILPFQGNNFTYFDISSYINDRAWLNHNVLEILLATYSILEEKRPDRHFFIMECSNKEGGRIFPHRTHQNGMSVDFMMPLKKNGQNYYGLDTIGVDHYLLSFTNEGRYSEDASIVIDFNLLALHILLLDEIARAQGFRIEKVIIKTELKDKLYNTEYGKKLKNSPIYLVKSLSPLINSLHDDHYHVDFAPLN